jgi:hypothetical protein
MGGTDWRIPHSSGHSSDKLEMKLQNADLRRELEGKHRFREEACLRSPISQRATRAKFLVLHLRRERRDPAEPWIKFSHRLVGIRLS